MSKIARWKAFGGEWVRYDDYRSEVERVMADVVKLRIERKSAQVEASQLRGEVERLKEQVAALTVAVEQADPSATLDAATDVADVALVEHLKRGPRCQMTS